MKKIMHLEYGQQERLAKSLARLCYMIALAMEDEQPASALKLLEASHDAHGALVETFHRYRGDKAVQRKLARALLAAKCTRAVLKRVSQDEPKDPARVTAALEIAERLVTMLQPPQPAS